MHCEQIIIIQQYRHQRKIWIQTRTVIKTQKISKTRGNTITRKICKQQEERYRIPKKDKYVSTR